MECTGKIVDASLNLATQKYQIVFEINERQALLQGFDEIKDEEKLSIKAVKYKQKRSLDANAYCWTLLHKMAQKTYESAEELYRGYIRDFGVCEIMPVKEDAIDRWCEIWRGKGYGWLTEDMGPCRNFKGYRNIKCFYGSSAYNTAEMSRLIDAIVQDCKELGIETMTSDEIARLKATWGNQS